MDLDFFPPSPAASSAQRPNTPTRVPPAAAWLLRTLDEVDYAIVLVGPKGDVQHLNHLARVELDTGVFLRSGADGRLLACHPVHQNQMVQAIARARRGQRSLCELTTTSELWMALAIVPLCDSYTNADTDAPVLILSSRSRHCERFTLAMYARSSSLTQAEESILLGLYSGKSVDDIAVERGVADSTVRTQLRQLRAKTMTDSICDLLRKVAKLPPMVPSLRG